MEKTHVHEQTSATPKLGLVASFDILGYKALCENNPLLDVVRIIDLLQEVPDKTKRTLKELFNDVNTANDSTWDNIRMPSHIVFADTILLHLDLSYLLCKSTSGKNIELRQNLSDEEHKDFAIHCFAHFYTSMTLARVLFEAKLPTRGAIDIGEYYVSKNCFAGMPFINCHTLADKLDFSGVVLTKNASDFLSRLPKSVSLAILSKFIVNYLAPLKDNKETLLDVLNWVKFGFRANEICNNRDDRGYVIDAFTGHNKPLSEKEESKVQNTELLIRLLKQK